jgi:hypothetical protein
MIAIDERPEFDVLSTTSTTDADLRVEGTDISFQDLAGERVRICVTIHNDGEQRSKPTFMKLESAPLGAFVTWQALAVMAVPSIEPGESREVSMDVARPRPEPLGSFDRIPPTRLLTAVGSADELSQPNRGLGAILNLLRRRQTGGGAGSGFAAQIGLLAPDLMDLLGRGHPHWAGNINVFIGTHAVERHMAKALRVYPGRTNLAVFMVGGREKRDSYAFEIAGSAPGWKATLFDMTNSGTLLASSSDTPIQETQWVEAVGGMGLMVILAAQPPADCEEGNVEVHVTRRSCQKTAIVEFNLDPGAQGAGCYFA